MPGSHDVPPLPPPPQLSPPPRSAVDEPVLAPGTMVGEYRIQHLLGQSPVAQIYAASHPLLGRRAAVSVLARLPVGQVTPADRFLREGAAIERFLAEVRAVQQVGHPNIVDVLGFGRTDAGRYYLATEWLRGETLAERMRSVHLPVAEALEVLDQIGDALEAAHDEGIAHRELHPSRIQLVPVRGQRVLAKVLDFGLATLFAEAAAGARRPRGFFAAAYVSPEQVRGERGGHRSDVYALGVIAYEMLLGRPPFDSDVVEELLAMHLLRDPPRPRAVWPAIDPRLEELLLAMLAKEPLQRPLLAEISIRIAELLAARR